MLANLAVPESMTICLTDSLLAFKEMLEKLKSESQDSQLAAKTCYSKIKFLVDSTENNTKMFSDLRKSEVKQYIKTKDAFATRIKRFYDTRYKIETMESEIDSLEYSLDQNTNKDRNVQSIKTKLKSLHQTLLKSKVEYSQMKVDAKDISVEFNQAKSKFVRVFNAYAENVELRVKDNLTFFVQRLSDFLSSFKLNNRSIPSNIQSSMIIDENTSQSHSSTDLSFAQVSTQFGDQRFIINELAYEEEKIGDPDLYLKFSKLVEGESTHLLKEIESWSRRIDTKEAQKVFVTATNVILRRAHVSDLIIMCSSSLMLRSLGNRIALFLVSFLPLLGKVPSVVAAYTVRDELISGAIGMLKITRILGSGASQRRG